MAIRALCSYFKAKKGSVAVIMAISMPVIVGFAGIGAEVMYWQYSQRVLQGAADAAAFSGAAQLAQGKSSSAQPAAQNAAVESGYNIARAGSPNIQIPPASGSFAGDPRAVEVTLTDNLPRMFSKIFFNTDTVQISARSVSRTAGARPACVLALNKSANKAVGFAGSSTLELDGCDVASNSIAADAIDFQGATSVTTECASAVGGVDGASGSLTLTDCAAPFQGARPFPDPYASLPMPSPGACDNGLKQDLRVSPGTVRTVSPGTICSTGSGGSNIQIKGDITFNPGIYIFDGVDVQVNATAHLIGAGVTFVFANNSEIHMNGGADIELSAPTSDADPYQGVLFFGDRSASSVTHQLNGSSATSFTGALYFPASDVEFSGTNVADANSCTLLIADEVTFTGNSFFGSDCSSIGVDAVETAQIVLIVE